VYKMKIVTVSQMQKAERDSAQFGISLDGLMENAGKAFAEETRNILGDIRKHKILVLVGPGNNGGDGLVAARHFHDCGAEVHVYLCGSRTDRDPNLELVLKRQINCLKADDDASLEQLQKLLQKATAVVDSLFGTGTSRPLSGIFAQVLSTISEAKKKRPHMQLIALDLPSGLNADTGSVDPATPFADNTVTLGFPKAGLFNLPGALRAGKISVVDIGIPAQLVDYVNIDLLTADWVRSALPERPLVSHKGTFGKVLAFVGSINYTGAAYLAASASIRAGAGLTTLAIARSLLPVLASKLNEVTFIPLPESETGLLPVESAGIFRQYLPQYDVWLLGCGIGQSQPVRDLMEKVLHDPQINLPPLVLDADGLSILAKIPDWQKWFQDEAIFTPHAGELSRLVGKSIEEIQSNRILIAKEAASRWHKIVVLKGAHTVIASPDGRVCVSPFANPGLASAGTGDVLAGAIAGLVAQGLPLFAAAACGVYLHGMAGDMVRSDLGDTGMLASDLLPVLPRAIRQLKEV
jgi:ADP-dependent NAD(P)H-hydrate dehydratase / NAD(P)H-hydrate epimerase